MANNVLNDEVNGSIIFRIKDVNSNLKGSSGKFYQQSCVAQMSESTSTPPAGNPKSIKYNSKVTKHKHLFKNNLLLPPLFQHKNPLASTYEFNMSSNLVSISANRHNDADRRVDVLYKISVVGIEPVRMQKDGRVDRQNKCSQNNGNHLGDEGWIVLNDKTNDIGSTTDSQPLGGGVGKAYSIRAKEAKCVLLLKPTHKNPHLSWNEANENCSKIGGSLISVKNKNEDRDIQSLIINR